MIYDCFTFYNELDILELRLRLHDSFVDKFVIVEATRTFQGNPKKLHFEENKDRYAAFMHKIIHVKFDFPETFEPHYLRENEIWARDFYQRDQISRGLTQAQPEDLIIVSDVDEILREEVFLRSLTERRKYDLTMYENDIMRFYVNRYFDYRQHREKTVKWIGPKMIEFCKFHGAQNMRYTKWFRSYRLHGTIFGEWHTRISNWFLWKHSSRPFLVRDAGWHFSSIGDWQNMRLKFESFAHDDCQELDTYKFQQSFIDHVRNDGQAYPLDKLPPLVLQHPEMFPLYQE